MKQTTFSWCPDEQGGDFIATPTEAVDALYASGLLPHGPVIDPFAGGGTILERLRELGHRGKQHAVEVREAELFHLAQLLPDDRYRIGDWYELNWWPTDRMLVVTNPPFSQIPAAPLSCLERTECYFAAFLMPVEEMAGVERATWLNRHPPSALINFKRRLWSGTRGIAWYIWQRGVMPLWMRVV